MIVQLCHGFLTDVDDEDNGDDDDDNDSFVSALDYFENEVDAQSLFLYVLCKN